MNFFVWHLICRYQNAVPVEKKVFKNLRLFKENKKDNDDLFDRLNTSILNQYLQQLMEGLTAKVFRTYNASFTLQQQLDELTDASDNVAAKMLSYNRANREVAILCNHQVYYLLIHDFLCCLFSKGISQSDHLKWNMPR